MGVSNFDIVKANGFIGMASNTGGQVFYVNNSSTGIPKGAKGGSNSNNGLSPLEPFATLKHALEVRVLSGRGDVVVVLPGHSETITEAIAWSASDVKVFGAGLHASAHTITTATADINLFDMTGDRCYLGNLQFTNTATVTTQTEMIDLGASGCTIDSCYFNFADAANVEGINEATGESNNTICNNVFDLPNNGESCVLYAGTNTKIVGNQFLLAGSSLGIEQLASPGDFVCIKDNLFSGDGTQQSMISWQSSPGAGNQVYHNTVFDAGTTLSHFGDDGDLDTQLVENFIGAADGTVAAINPSVS